MPSRWLAWAVLGAATTLSALVGIAGVSQLREPAPPDSLAELTERMEAAGIGCGGVTTADATESTFICGDEPEAVSVTYYHRLPTGVSSGRYIALRTLGAEPSELSGERFVVLGPYETLLRLQRELGGRLQRLSSGQ